MKTYKFTLAALTWLVLMTSCTKMTEDHALCQAVAQENVDEVEAWVNHYSKFFSPMVTAEDAYGHEANLSLLIEELDGIECLDAEPVCYACIETYPPISQIRLSSEGVSKVIFLRTSPERCMKFVGWRD